VVPAGGAGGHQVALAGGRVERKEVEATVDHGVAKEKATVEEAMADCRAAEGGGGHPLLSL